MVLRTRHPAALAPRAGSSARGPRWALASLGWESQDEGRYSSFVYSCSAQPGEERERITACRSTGRGDQSGVETSASPTPGSTALHLSVPSRSGRGIYRSSPKTPDALARAPAVAAPQRLLVSPRRASVRVPLTIVRLTRPRCNCPIRIFSGLRGRSSGRHHRPLHGSSAAGRQPVAAEFSERRLGRPTLWQVPVRDQRPSRIRRDPSRGSGCRSRNRRAANPVCPGRLEAHSGSHGEVRAQPQEQLAHR